MKYSRNKHPFKQPTTHLSRKIQSWYAKEPILVFVGLFVLLGVLCGVSYGTYRYVANQIEHDDNAKVVATDQNETKIEDGLSDIDTDLKDTKAGTPQKASVTKKDKSDPRAPTPTTGAGCVGVRCLKQGGFKIIASPRVITVTAGEHFGPIKLRTADGRKADWGGMPSDGRIINGDYVGVHTYGQTDFPGWSKGYDYYMESRTKAKGTYYLTFSASRKDEGHWAQTTVTVKVLPQTTFVMKLSNSKYYITANGLSVNLSLFFTDGVILQTKTNARLTCPGLSADADPSVSNHANVSIYFHGVTKPSSTLSCTVKITTSLSDGSDSQTKSFAISLK